MTKSLKLQRIKVKNKEISKLTELDTLKEFLAWRGTMIANRTYNLSIQITDKLTRVLYNKKAVLENLEQINLMEKTKRTDSSLFHVGKTKLNHLF